MKRNKRQVCRELGSKYLYLKDRHKVVAFVCFSQLNPPRKVFQSNCFRSRLSKSTALAWACFRLTLVFGSRSDSTLKKLQIRVGVRKTADHRSPFTFINLQSRIECKRCIWKQAVSEGEKNLFSREETSTS
jgi:hypothetical protein